MKDIGEKDRERDIIAELAATENSGDESARRKVHEGFSDWVSSIKSVKLTAKAKALWRHLNDKQTPVASKAAIIAALLYCVVPADMVPDFVPLSGLVDDLAIVLSVLAFVDARAATDKAVDVDAETSATDNDGTPGKNPNETAL